MSTELSIFLQRRLGVVMVAFLFVVGGALTFWRISGGNTAGLFLDWLFLATAVLTVVSMSVLGAEELRRVRSAAESSEIKYRALVDRSPTGMVLIDEEGRIAVINAELERIFGYSRDELVGQRIEILVPETVRPQHPGLRQAYFDRPETRSMGRGRDLFGVHKNGTEVPVEIGLNPIRIDGQMFAMASVVDISVRKSIVASIAKAATDIANGELPQHELDEGSDELGRIASAFNTMSSNLRSLIGQIVSVTENVNSAATQVSASASQQASSSKQQAATVQEITSTMREISQTGAQILEKAKELSTATEAGTSASQSGISAAQETNRTMEAIREQVEEVAQNIVALSEKTQAVGDIVATVNEVAEQSNLLALNATIEAASAGDQGSRFSVIANEMKNLADQAKQCTVQVRDILGEIQKGINSSVMLTEEAVKRVESGKQRTQITEDTIRRMSQTTEDNIQAFQQIIGATNQQQIGFEQVAKGMEDIREATQQTASGTSQLEQAVGSLSALGRQLKTAVRSYQLS